MKTKRVLYALIATLSLSCTAPANLNLSDSTKPLSLEAVTIQAESIGADSTQNTSSSTLSESSYDKLVADSFISTGNTYRFMKAIEKAQKGEDVTIAFIGGSITEGKCSTKHKNSFAYLFYTMFKERFGKNDGSNIHYVNAGMDGTPSTVGILRYDRDVLSASPTAPDIVIVDFCVNDDIDVTLGNAYESLIRRIINSENKPACLTLFNIFSWDWNLQDRMIPISEYYDLPMLSMKNSVMPAIKNGTLKTSDYFAEDTIHPVDFGHKLIADSIMYCVDQMIAKGTDTEDIIVPDKPVIGKDFEDIVTIDSKTIPEGVTLNKGSFKFTDYSLGRFQYTNKLKFPNSMKCPCLALNESLTLNATCKKALLSFKLSGRKTAGAVDLYIDGNYVTNINSSNGDWERAYCIEILNEDVSANHTFEFKIAKGSELKTFSILDIGIVK